MSGYENNKNTKRLATDCCVCGRALRDSKSVETGIGPICRKKYGFDARYSKLTPAQQAAVNSMIHKAGVACEAGDIKLVLELADEIEKNGFDFVATRVRTRFVKIRIMRVENVDEYGWTPRRGEFPTGKKHNVVRVWTPFSPEFNGNRRDNRLRGRPCKEQTEYGKFHWEFKVEHSPLLMRVLAMTFPGSPYLCDKGVFNIPTAEELNKTFTKYYLKPLPTYRR